MKYMQVKERHCLTIAREISLRRTVGIVWRRRQRLHNGIRGVGVACCLIGSSREEKLMRPVHYNQPSAIPCPLATIDVSSVP